MNKTLQLEIQKIARKNIIESNPMSDIALLSLSKILNEPNISREDKLKHIIEYNFPFEIVHQSLESSRELKQLEYVDYTFLLLQLINWYKVKSVDQQIYWAA